MAERVIIESPYAGEDEIVVEANLRYLRACMADAFKRGEAPFASHGLYTQPGVLDDRDPAQRKQGMEAGFEWMLVAHRVVVYADLGVSDGMRAGIARAERLGLPVSKRLIWERCEDCSELLSRCRCNRRAS